MCLDERDYRECGRGHEGRLSAQQATRVGWRGAVDILVRDDEFDHPLRPLRIL